MHHFNAVFLHDNLPANDCTLQRLTAIPTLLHFSIFLTSFTIMFTEDNSSNNNKLCGRPPQYASMQVSMQVASGRA